MKSRMRALLLLAMIGVVGSMVMAAVLRLEVYVVGLDEVTIDSQYGGNWEPLGTLIVVTDSNAIIEVTVSGVAIMDYYDKLYIGFGNDSANRVNAATAATTGQTNANLDTVLIVAGGTHRTGKRRVAFSVSYWDSLAALTDTFYVNMAVGGSTGGEKVDLEDVFFSVQLHHKP